MTSQFVSFILFCLSATSAWADTNATDTKSSIFVFNSTSTHQIFAFAINAVQSTGDIYFHLEAPAGNAWAAVGIGSEMENSLIFVAYSSANGSGVTISPRIGTGHSEPEYYSAARIEVVSDPTLANANSVDGDGILRADAVCRNCTSWRHGKHGGSIDLSNPPTTAQFIFAIGPDQAMRSDSPSASLRRHQFFGHFTMDLEAATSANAGAVPRPNGSNGTYQATGSSGAKGTSMDSDYTHAAHALVMLVAFVFVFPFGSLVLRVLHRVIWHAAIQVFALFLILVGFGLGVSVSLQYNKSKSFTSPHQAIGLIILVALLFQLGLGLLNHRNHTKQNRSPAPQRTKMSRIHTYLGTSIIVLGILNGFSGFHFAGSPYHNFPYAIIVLAMVIVYLTIRGLVWFCSSKRKDGKKSAAQDEIEGYQYPTFDPPEPYGAAVPLKQFPAQPGRA